MENLCLFVRYEIWFLLLGFALVIGYQILTGKINTKGLLLDKETGKLSPGRVQLLTFTLFGVLYYFFQVLEDPIKGFPDIPDGLLYALGGSNAFYLGGKSYSRLFRR